MYQPQSAIPTALQALMVLRQQASPVAPGPGGQPIPTVAAQTAQQVMQPPQTQMGPQMPQGTLPGAAQNAGLGNAIEMQQQQAAQKALMDQMLAQQQQPMMAAEGGLASLPASNMDSFAEGGVVGFTEGGMPKIPVGEATETGNIWSEEAKRWLKELLERQQATEAGKTAAPKIAEAVESSPSKLRTLVQGLRNVGSSGLRSAFSLPGATIFGVGSLLSNRATEQMQQSPELRAAYDNPMLGAMDPNGALAAAILSQPTTPGPDQTLRERLGLGNEANRKVLEEIAAAESAKQTTQPTSVESAPAKFQWAQGADPMRIISVLSAQLKNDKDLTPENRTLISKEIERQYDIYRSQQPVVSAEAASRRAAGSGGISPEPSNIQRPTFASAASQLAAAFPAVSDQGLRDKIAGLEALQAQRATPDEAISQLEATRARQREIYERQLARQGSMPELMAVLGSISKRGDGLTGLEEYRSARDTAALAQVALDQNLFKEKQLLRDKYLADQIGDKEKSIGIEQELYKNKVEREKIMMQTAGHIYGSQATMYGADVGADQRLQSALIRADTAEERLRQGATGKVMSLAERQEHYADNWEKMDPVQKMALAKQNPPIVTFQDYVNMRERMLAGNQGGQMAPAPGTVMQGYRFKGGNPADRNNWEKV